MKEFEQKSFDLILHFLNKYPDQFSKNGRVILEFPLNTGNESDLLDRFIKSRNAPKLSTPGTVDDAVVKKVIGKAFSVTENRIEQVLKEHRQTMVSENYAGFLLEKYIASILEPLGWAWVGNLVRGTDLLFLDGDTWIQLQIKMRNNSENSSSSAIRHGTAIKKWHRLNARTGNTNWDNFPDEAAKKHLSEIAFLDFVDKELLATKESH